MSKLSDRFRAAGVVNPWDLLTRFGEKPLDVALTFHPYMSRSMNCARTEVWSPNRKLVPSDGHWMDRGNKVFNGRREKSHAEALAWACEQTETAPEDWVPAPVGSRGTYVHKSVRDAALKWLKEFEKKGAKTR